MDSRYRGVRLIFFTGSALLAFVAGIWLIPPGLAEWVLRYLVYWILLFILGLFAWSLVRLFRVSPGGRSWREMLRTPSLRRFGTVAFGLFVSLLFLLLQPAGYKVVMDEPLQVAVSRQMHLEKENAVPDRCYELGGAFYSFDSYLDKRPAFFPFLLSLMHDLTGYRSQQGLWLNALLTPLFVGLLMWAGSRLWPAWGAFAAPLLALTVPLFAIVANGSGFDFLNAVLLLSLLYFGTTYLRAPSERTLDPLLLCTVLLAFTRYESALYVLPVGFIVLFGWRVSRSIHLSPAAVAVPLMLIPVLLQQRVIQANSDYWQTRAGDGAAFSVDYLAGNLAAAGEYFFNFGEAQPNSWLLSIAFVLALLVGFVLLLRKTASGIAIPVPVKFTFGFVGVTVLLSYGLVLFYHWGQLSDFAASRLALPFILFQIGAVCAVGGQISRLRGFNLGFVASVAVYFLAVTRPVCASTDFLSGAPATRWAHWLRQEVLERRGENVLFVTQQRLIPVNEEVSGISLGNALGGKAELALHHRLETFDDILFAFLRIEPLGGGGRYEDDIPVEPHFELVEIERHRLDASRVMILSRLRAVRLASNEPVEALARGLRAGDLADDWFTLIPETLP